MGCPHERSYELFPQFTMEATLKLWTMRYCHADHAKCARYQMVLRGETVPPTLLPNGRLLRYNTARIGSSEGR